MSMTEKVCGTTIEEALEDLKETLHECVCSNIHYYTDRDMPMLQIAISAIEEIQQYRAIGTVSEFRELKEKATAKKVITKGQGHETDCYCPNPNCNKFMGNDQDWCFNQTKHCSECGQALEEY